MYQCVIPPRVFLAVGVGLLIFSLVLGWISFSVPDWLQYYERSGSIYAIKRDGSNETNIQDSTMADLKKFGLWQKCIFSVNSNDFDCASWTTDPPGFVRVARVLVPFGLSLECISFFSAFIGFISRKSFVRIALVAALCAFLSFIFTTIGITVFATESLVFVERFHSNENQNPRRWAMWLFIPNIALSFLASLCFILASVFNWCDYRTMKATGILSHAVDKYAGSVFKAPSDSTNVTSGTKKQQYLHQQQNMNGQDYPNTCYQLNGTNNNQNSLSYPPPPPSYGGPLNQHGGNGPSNSAFQTNHGLFGYSRPPSPTYPHSSIDPYHHRNYMTENSEMEEISRVSGSRRYCRSNRRSNRRSRSPSPQENGTTGNNTQDNNSKQPQFIPIPVPYYHPPVLQQQQQQQQKQPQSSAPITTQQQVTQAFNTIPNTNTNHNQPMSYIIQPPKQHFIEEMIQPTTTKSNNMLAYCSEQPSLLMSNATQPVYTIAYRANNGGNLLTSNIISGPAGATYVTATRDQISELNTLNNDSDDEGKTYRTTTKQYNAKKTKTNETWTWRKL